MPPCKKLCFTALFLLVTSVALSEPIQTGKTYRVKKLKYYAPKGEEKNSVAHFIVYREGGKGHVVEVFCAIPPGVDPTAAKSITVGERASADADGKDYFCEIAK